MSIRFTNNIILILFFTAIITFIGCSKQPEKMSITTSSDEAEKLYKKGITLADRLRRDEAIEFFEKAIELDSNFAMAYLGLAFAQQSPQQLLPNLQKAIDLKNTVSEGERLWIDATEAQLNNQTEEQRIYLRKLMELYPQDERARNFYATTYFATQEYQEAIKQYLKVLEINPTYSQVYNQLGYAYRFLQNYNESEKMFQKYIELIPNDPNPYDSYGELLMQIGKFDKSIENYEKALQVNPYFTISYLGIASNLNYKDEHVKARNRLQKLLSSANNDNQRRVAYNGIILSLIDEGNLEDALQMTLKMKQLAVNTNDTLTMLNENFPHGVLLLEMHRPAEARELFEQSKNFIENSSFSENLKLSALNNAKASIARVDIQEKKFEDATEKANEVLEFAEKQSNPNLIRLANQIFAQIAFYQDDYETAIEYFRNSDQSNPNNIYLMALSYEQLGDTERAQSFFDKAAHANLVSNRNYSFIRKKALAKLE